MIKKVLIFLTFLLFIGPFLIGQTEKTAEKGQKPPDAWINYVEGTDGIIQGLTGSENLSANIIIQQGDKIISNDTVVEISFGKGNYLRIWKNSEVKFVALENAVVLDLTGDAYLRIEDLKKEFTVNFAGSTSKISTPGLYQFTKEKNQVFDQFNEKREEELKPAESSRLPEELQEYDSTLNHHGKWEYIEDNWGWVPTVVTTDWQPFSLGYWDWYPTWGNTWISYEPWGWATYHYGGWYWSPLWGWYWQPGIFWSPAWVYWWHDNDYYGWAPQGYRDCPKDRAWSFVRKDQLKKHGSQDPQRTSQNILRKDQLKRTVNLSSSQISQRGPSAITSIEGRGLISLSPEKITERGKISQVKPRERYYPLRLTSSQRPTIRTEDSLKTYPSRLGRESISKQGQREKYYPSKSRRITRGENRTSWRSFFDRPIDRPSSSSSSSRSLSITRSPSRISSGPTKSGSSISRSSAPTRSSGQTRSSSGSSRSASSGRVRKK
jgi:hypothetical protein